MLCMELTLLRVPHTPPSPVLPQNVVYAVMCKLLVHSNCLRCQNIMSAFITNVLQQIFSASRNQIKCHLICIVCISYRWQYATKYFCNISVASNVVLCPSNNIAVLKKWQSQVFCQTDLVDVSISSWGWRKLGWVNAPKNFEVGERDKKMRFGKNSNLDVIYLWFHHSLDLLLELVSLC